MKKFLALATTVWIFGLYGITACRSLINSKLCIEPSVAEDSGLSGNQRFDVELDPDKDNFDGQAAYKHILAQVAFGYRIPGLNASRLTSEYIKETLESYGWKVSIQEFIFDQKKIRNVIAINRNEKPKILLGTHFDTRAYSDQEETPDYYATPIVGANDGASGTAILLELGKLLIKSEKDIGMVFFDAEDQGGLYGWDWSVGARYFVHNLNYMPKKVIIIDMVGDRDLNIYREINSDQPLCDEIWDSAIQIGYHENWMDQMKYSLIDDHTPFIEAGLPACLIIDFDYPYWHTNQDTPDKVSPDSLKIVGDVLLNWIKSN